MTLSHTHALCQARTQGLAELYSGLGSPAQRSVMPVRAPPRTQWLAACLAMVTQSGRGPDSVIAALIRLRALSSAVRFPEAET